MINITKINTSPDKKKVIGVIGANSMVGSRFCELTSVASLIKADLQGEISIDITSKKSVDDFFAHYNFERLVLFSAFTDVDGAEKQRGDKNGSCWQINVEGVKNVVGACRKFKRGLIFISTDFVFDGTSGPYSEDDQVGPDLNKVSWYGISKIEAEKTVINGLSDYIILRISYPYRARYTLKADIAKRILKLYKKEELYPMFGDQIITPTFIDDLAPAIKLLIRKNQKGIFHLASPKATTQYDFAKELLTIFGEDTNNLKKASILDFLKEKDRTPRPANSGLLVEKITNLGFKPTDWKEGIRKIYDQSQGRLI